MHYKLSTNKELVLYSIATYAFSWLFWISSAIMFKGTESVGELITSPIFIILQTMGAAGPTIVAYIFLKKFHHPSDLKTVIARYKIWRVELKWYFISIFLVITISLVSLLLQTVFLDTPLGKGHALYDMYQGMGLALLAVLPLVYVAQIFTSPLLEEFGWRGYLQPHLQKIFGVLSASIIIGVIWGFWHLPLIFAYGHNLVIAIVSIVCHSILMGWILNSTKGSMLMMLLFHASINVGVNMLSPGHESVIMLIITVVVTGLVVFHIIKSQLKSFNHTETLEHKINLGRA
jgi:uncharacterized protein